MDVSAIFELAVHIWVVCDALAAKYPTGYGEQVADAMVELGGWFKEKFWTGM